MTGIEITQATQFDDTLFSRPGITRIDVRGVSLDEVPAGFAKLADLQLLFFHHCTLKSFHPKAFEAGATKGKVEVEFAYCTFDADALFELALVHGLGTWRVEDYGSNYRRDPRWKQLASIGADGLGQEAFRRAAFALAGKAGLKDGVPAEEHFRLLDHSKKPLRELAALWLDKNHPSPIGSGAVSANARVLVLGTPLRHDKAALQARFEALGFSVAKSVKDATAMLLFPKPGPKLGDALAAKLPLLVEAHLEGAASQALPAPPPATAAEGESLEKLLFNADPKNALLGLSLAKARKLEGELLAHVVAVAFFSADASVRKEGRALLLAAAPEALRGRLQGDKRNYATIEDGSKLLKLAKELADFGVDPQEFTRAMIRVALLKPNRYGGSFDAPLAAALGFPGHEERVFELLADESDVYLSVKKTFPKGLSKLRALTKLRIPHATVTSDKNVAELAQIPQPFHLEYWVKDTNFAYLRSIAKNVAGLYLRGSYSNVSDLSELATWDNLRHLSVEGTAVTDLSPLSGLPLEFLDVRDTPITSLDPIRTMTSLKHLRVGRFRGDLSALADLVNVEVLDISFTKVTELGVLAKLSKLRNLDLWGTAVVNFEPLVGKPLDTLGLNYMSGKPVLTPLEEIPTLGWISMTGTAVDEAQLAELQKRLPNLNVSR
jgi:hypothetical protein